MEDPVFKKAIVNSIRSFFKDKAFGELTKSQVKIKYNRKYFKKIEMDFFGDVKEHELG